MKAKLIKYPTAEDWMFAKRCTLVTVGKEAVKEPTQEWKHKILEARHIFHSGLVEFCIDLKTIRISAEFIGGL